MKTLFIGAALISAVLAPSIASAAPAAPAAPAARSPAAQQNVYRSETVVIIENSDGSESVSTTYTSYYVFGIR
jgi:hypothetical protein